MMTVDGCNGDSITTEVMQITSRENPNSNNNNNIINCNSNNAPATCCSSPLVTATMAASNLDCNSDVKESTECDGNQEQSGTQNVDDDSSEILIESCVVKVCEEDESLKSVNGQSKEEDVRTDEPKDIGHKMCQTTFENPRRQSLQLLNLRRRLAEQVEANKRLRLEKDEQLQDISTNLMILESQLRREQERIARLLEEKNQKIIEQDRHIQALLRLNRKLAANCHRKTGGADGKCTDKKLSRKQRRISWHNEVHVIVDYDQPWSRTNFRDCQVSGTLAESESRTEVSGASREAVCLHNGNASLVVDDYDPVDFARAAAEACDAVNKVLQESGGDSAVGSPCQDSVISETTFLPSVREDEPLKTSDCRSLPSENPASVVPCSLSSPSSLGVYNRVMSNHRSVTKPKDVKYKRISRVKSRSLEELRGRLRRHLTHPPVSEHILLESNEEV